MDEYCDYITTAVCDSCGRRSPGVQLHCRAAPVLFLCHRPACGGAMRFEAVAERDKAEWLAEAS